MKLFPKIIGIGIVGLLVAAAIATISIYIGRSLGDIQAERAKYRTFEFELAAARIAHLGWVRNISSSILTEKSKDEVKIVTDGKLCAFGKWYYSDGTKLAETLPEDFQTAFHKIAKNHLHIHELGEKILEVWDKDDMKPAIELMNSQINPIADLVLAELQELETTCLDAIKTNQERAAWLLANQSVPTLITLLIGTLILLPYSWLTARGIVVPLQKGEDILQDIADNGNISASIPMEMRRRKDEIGGLGRDIERILSDYRSLAEITGKLAEGDWQITVREKSPADVMNQSFAKMLDQVNDALHSINEGVGQVATGSGEVSTAAQSLSSGAQEAAASLEEITASMNEISGQTKKNAGDASQARDLAQKASKAASDGQTAMTEMTSAMARITQNSSEIQRVIKVIDDIAFQTNLLALNAAVEAARAGQHGKGFAVVAEEVRNLAARSAKAAKETSELIAKSSQEIGKGGEVANHTAEVLTTIVDQIKQTTDLVAGIAVASNEQAQGVNQVTIGLQQIDSVTQQNTAAAEESASAASEMSSMAANLQKLVAQFRLR